MMRPARRASLLVALCLLTSAATAHAESKWVLWKHSYEVWIDTNKVGHRREFILAELAGRHADAAVDVHPDDPLRSARPAACDTLAPMSPPCTPNRS